MMKRFSTGVKPRKFAVVVNTEGDTRFVLYPARRSAGSRGQVMSVAGARSLLEDLQAALAWIDGGQSDAQ